MSSIPGIETRAPERTETSSGSSGSPSAFPVRRSSSASASSTSSASPSGELAAGLHVGDAGLGRDREPGRHPLGPRTRVISATPAPLPPSSSRWSREPSENSWIHLIAPLPSPASPPAPARASTASARLRLASSIISPSSITAPSLGVRRARRGSPAPARPPRAWARRARSEARSESGAAPTCRRSRARAPAAADARRPAASAICRNGPSIAWIPAARAATSTAPRTKSQREPSSGEGKPSDTLMSAGPRISASSSGRPRRSRSRREARAPTRSAPAGRSVARARRGAGLGEQRRGAPQIGGGLDLRHDHRVESLAGAGDRPEVVGEPRGRGAVDAHADRR